jgi:hypothetical protein
VPSVPEGSDEVAIASCEGAAVAGATVIDSAADCDWIGVLPSLTATVKLKVPLVVGVPVKAPLPATKPIPAGRLPDVIDHV